MKAKRRPRKLRRMARKQGLDFRVGCAFDEQLRAYTLGPEDGKVVVLPTESGRRARYRMCLKRWRSTGQKDWKFEFLGYLEEGGANGK